MYVFFLNCLDIGILWSASSDFKASWNDDRLSHCKSPTWAIVIVLASDATLCFNGKDGGAELVNRISSPYKSRLALTWQSRIQDEWRHLRRVAKRSFEPNLRPQVSNEEDEIALGATMVHLSSCAGQQKKIAWLVFALQRKKRPYKKPFILLTPNPNPNPNVFYIVLMQRFVDII